MTHLNPNFVLASLSCGVVGLATLAVAPQYVGAPLACFGGFLGGAGLVSESTSKKRKEEETALKVTQTFSSLYEINRGIIDPVQLSFLANIPVDKAHNFLNNLAEANNGQKIAIKDGVGVVFAFPHSSAALDELSINAKKWADAQNQKLVAELAQHKQILQALQAHQQAQTKQVTPSPWENVSPSI